MQDYIIKFVIDHVAYLIGFGALMAVGVWVRGILVQSRKNVLNEVHLEGEKIQFETHSEPLDKLVSDSNASHGVSPGHPDDSSNPVVPVTGNGSDKK